MMYHVTAARNVAPIMERGLRTDGMGGWDTGYVWLFDDRDLAYAMAQRTWGGSRECVVIEVDVTGLVLAPDPHPGWGDWRDAHSFVHAGPIEPARLEVLTPVSVLQSR